MNARRLPGRNSAPNGIRPNPSRNRQITVDRLIANLPTRLCDHPGYNAVALQHAAQRTVERLQSVRAEEGNGEWPEVSREIADTVLADLQPACTASEDQAVGFLFEGIALALLRMFIEAAARQMLRWAWKKMAE